jgi:asparagine synthase (glutamine-hydrolysing)
MCGIAGFSGTGNLDLKRVTQTLPMMQRRGPDAQGYERFAHRDRQTVLLHARLSIIDLDDRANQPFQCGTRWLSFNGELYNYQELRSELETLGYSFATTSDTEVLLRTIDAFGWDGLDRCEGMWAFALYDDSDKSLTLCRDRFGEKPLYMFRDDTGVYFGSEVKFITALRGHAMKVDYQQLYRYLVNGYKSLYKGANTYFEGLTELPRATYLRIAADGSETTTPYWQPSLSIDSGMSREAAVAGTREKLIEAVRIRLRSDVPLAFCLSGGIDSNALASIAKRVFDYDVHGFTIVNTDERYEESELVEHSVRTLNIKHTEIALQTDGFLDNLREQVRHHDAPVATITYYAHWLLQQHVKDHGYRISVSGTAADELFAGYYDHHNAYLSMVHGDEALFAESLKNWQTHILPEVRNPHLSNPRLFIDNPNHRDHIYLNNEEFAQYLKADWFEPYAETTYCDDLLRNRMLNELFHEATPVILREDDLNAMYHSIENRSPFLDRSLFEFAFSIPTHHLIRGGFNKSVLRDALRGIVPDPILDTHRKVGFNAPIMDLLDVNDPDVKAYLLDDSPIYDHVSREKIEPFFAKPELLNSESKFLFYFLNAKMFLEEFGT